jgi:hypothetical protein
MCESTLVCSCSCNSTSLISYSYCYHAHFDDVFQVQITIIRNFMVPYIHNMTWPSVTSLNHGQNLQSCERLLVVLLASSPLARCNPYTYKVIKSFHGVESTACGLVVRVPGYRSRGPGFDSWRYQIFWEVVCLELGPFSLVSTIEELLGRKSSGSGLENREYDSGDLLWSRNTLYLQKLALCSLTSGGHLVGIVCFVNLWSRALFEKLIATQIVKKFPTLFMEYEGSLLCS